MAIVIHEDVAGRDDNAMTRIGARREVLVIKPQ
jgi:hypothetical protein